MEDLEPFYPDRMAGRILGMGDVLSFVEKAQEVMRVEDAEDLQKKIMSAKYDFNDFLKQTKAIAQMGSMSRIMGMIPGMGKITPAQIREAEKSLILMEAMIEAMTPEEREKPELLAESPVRRKRVAQDSGKTEQQVCKVTRYCLVVAVVLILEFLVADGYGGGFDCSLDDGGVALFLRRPWCCCSSCWFPGGWGNAVGMLLLR
ncbi:hypothetical protein C3L33_22316, partial [Rhododendron williamsianum]